MPCLLYFAKIKQVHGMETSEHSSFVSFIRQDEIHQHLFSNLCEPKQDFTWYKLYMNKHSVYLINYDVGM